MFLPDPCPNYIGRALLNGDHGSMGVPADDGRRDRRVDGFQTITAEDTTLRIANLADFHRLAGREKVQVHRPPALPQSARPRRPGAHAREWQVRIPRTRHQRPGSHIPSSGRTRVVTPPLESAPECPCPRATRSSCPACSAPATGKFAGSSSPTCTRSEA